MVQYTHQWATSEQQLKQRIHSTGKANVRENSTDRKPEDPKLLLVFSYVPLSIPLDVHFPAPYPLTLSFSIPSSFSKPAHNSPPTIHIPPPYSPPFFLLPLFHHNHSRNRRHRHPNVPRPPRLGATAVSGRNGPRDSN